MTGSERVMLPWALTGWLEVSSELLNLLSHPVSSFIDFFSFEIH